MSARQPRTLKQQLGMAISTIFLIALAGVEAIHLRSAQSHLQRQLESIAQDAATSLGLSLGAMSGAAGGADAALAETVINPVFDRGHYAGIEFADAAGRPIVRKTLPPAQGGYPRWFAELLPLEAPTAESLVSSGWRQLGKVRVSAHPRFAYEQLWQTARDTMLYLLIIYALALLALRLHLRGLLRPLLEVERAAQQISERNFVTLEVKPGTRELARVVEAMNSLSRKVNESIGVETRRAEQLQAAAHRDEVTGLLNASGFAARFEGAYDVDEDEESFDGLFALVELADLGGINRELGTERCDELLRSLNGRLAEAAHAAGGFAGRWTGGQTVLAMPRIRSDGARAALTALRESALLCIREFGLTQLGEVYCAGVDAADPTALAQLKATVQEALLQARQSEDQVVLIGAASPADQHAARSVALVEEVREALAARRLSLVGQPVHAMSGAAPLHTEIMTRLRAASGREMAAAEFVPIVAAHGLGAQLDRAVVERVLENARNRDAAVAINLSMRSVEQAEFMKWLELALKKDTRMARRLSFEVAEHGVIGNQAAAAALGALAQRTGSAFAIDHFGAHSDSLALMQRLKPAYLKLAAAHTRTMASDAGTRFFAESLIRAARQLDIPVFAQNVEDQAALDTLGPLGFAGFQGNLRGAPAPWPAG